MDIRTHARIVAEIRLEDEPRFEGDLDRFIEYLDGWKEDGEYLFRHLAFGTLSSAVRSAARKLNRYDSKTDTILRR